jgi:protoheme IX farnesyltransferase
MSAPDTTIPRPSARPARGSDYLAAAQAARDVAGRVHGAGRPRGARHPDHPILGAVAVLCIAVGAGASGALNMWYDADIDALMKRTAKRADPGRPHAPAGSAGLRRLVLGCFSVMTARHRVNWLAAGLLAFTIFFYAVIYTMWLKRSTPQNIVIGGAAGALPPVIGWAAVTGDAPLERLLIRHHLPVDPAAFLGPGPVQATTTPAPACRCCRWPRGPGTPACRSCSTAWCSCRWPWRRRSRASAGLTYLAVSSVGGLGFLLLAWRVFKSRAGDAPDDRRDDGLYDVKANSKDARNLFAFSILYLFSLFATLLVEAAAGWPALTAVPVLPVLKVFG